MLEQYVQYTPLHTVRTVYVRTVQYVFTIILSNLDTIKHSTVRTYAQYAYVIFFTLYVEQHDTLRSSFDLETYAHYKFDSAVSDKARLHSSCNFLYYKKYVRVSSCDSLRQLGAACGK